MNQEHTCVFCEIVAGRRTAEIVYENHDVLAFLDGFRQPAVGGHVLIVPRDHYQDLWSLPDPLCAPLLRTAQATSRALRDITPGIGIRVWISNGPSAGQEVMHLHVHVFPCRSKFDLLQNVVKALSGNQRVSDERLAEMAKPIRARLKELTIA